MRYGSVCSGVEAATVAWHPLGWKPQWFSEIEQFPSDVLQYHYPNVPNLGDMTKFKEWPHDRSIELLVGGTPCQSFSVAGLRKGLSDPRGNLMLTYLAIAARYSPRWLVWENVPGVLSSNQGRDFGTFLWALGELGYGFAYRTLDAQYFGVAQRRRRVFVVGYFGDWRRAAAVLFERESLQGNPPPSREKKKEITGTVTTRSGNGGGGGLGTDEACSGFLQPEKVIPDVCPTSDTTLAKQVNNQMVKNAEAFYHAVAFTSNMSVPDCQTDGSTPTVKVGGHGGGNPPAVAYGIPGNWIGRKPENGGNSTTPMNNIAPNLTSTDKHGVAYSFDSLASNSMKSNNPNSGCRAVNLAKTLDTSNQSPAKNQGGIAVLNKDQSYLQQAMKVRRLTPIECERLQGFPDNYTQIPYRNKDAEYCPDGPRYKAMGNSMAVPVMRWIGERINMVESIQVSDTMEAT